jgi:hypothetical protein
MVAWRPPSASRNSNDRQRPAAQRELALGDKAPGASS